jgi:hypothetical protein
MKLYTAKEVVEMNIGLNSVSTLNKWVNFITKNCNYEFSTIDLPFESYQNRQRKMYHKQARAYSVNDIQRFKQVASSIKELGRDEALRIAFGVSSKPEPLSYDELIDKIVSQFNDIQSDFDSKIQALTVRNQQLLAKIQALEQDITILKEETEQRKSGRLGFGGKSRKSLSAIKT